MIGNLLGANLAWCLRSEREPLGPGGWPQLVREVGHRTLSVVATKHSR